MVDPGHGSGIEAFVGGVRRRLGAGPGQDGRAALPLALARAAVLAHAEQDLRELISRRDARLALPTSGAPRVSVVIATHDAPALLLRLLSSLAAHTRDVAHEVIVVTDAPSVPTLALLERVDGAQVVPNLGPRGYLHACNAGFTRARGELVALMNDDVEVTTGWLSTLAAALDADPGRGAVGPRLVLPDGTLQECGSIVWADGTALGYGRGGDPRAQEHLHAREVDYASAACLLVRRALLEAAGGYDPRYAPAYYEDTDLCFELRELGASVWVEPRAHVWHHEGASHRPELAGALMGERRAIFAARWAAALRDRPSPRAPGADPRAVLRARDRRPGPRVLVIENMAPAPVLGSGYPRAADLLRQLASLGAVTTLLTTWPAQPAAEAEADALRGLGIEVLAGLAPEDVLDARAGLYEVVVVSRPHNAERLISRARARFPRARLVYDCEALACTRELRQERLALGPSTDDPGLLAARIAAELAVADPADVVLAVSDLERRQIQAALPGRTVEAWGHTYVPRHDAPGFAPRRGLLFVGALGEGNAPNHDAVLHLACEILPRVARELPDVRLHIVGSGPSPRIRALASERIVVTGAVPSVAPYYDQARVVVVPLRFGAGASYKVGEALAQGVPVVASTVAAEGYRFDRPAPVANPDGRDEGLVVAASDDELVRLIVRLHEDEAAWARARQDGLELIRARCAPGPMRDALARALGISPPARAIPVAPAAPLAGPTPLILGPGVVSAQAPAAATEAQAARCAALEHDLAALRASASWRWTAPLRLAYRLVTGRP